MRSKKKEERHVYVRKRAEEFARSGDFSSWLFIELAIKNEGYPEARSILDVRSLRQQLDSTCKIAQSDSEKENRAQFKKWINDFVSTDFPSLEDEFPGVRLSIHNNAFSFSNEKKEIEIHRIFSSRKLTGQLRFFEKEKHRYVIDHQSLIDKNFDQFDMDDLQSMIRIVTVNNS
jgi:hypothetical protein